MTKQQQLTKNGKIKQSKKLPKAENISYRQWLQENITVCQICGIRQPEDAHHLNYGSYGADKDDKTQIAVCRVCHIWLHANKRKGIERYSHIAQDNWSAYAH